MVDKFTIKNVEHWPLNWEYQLYIETDIDYTCTDYGCGEEGICRCGTVAGIVIKSMHFCYDNRMFADITKTNNPNEDENKFAKFLFEKSFERVVTSFTSADLEDMFEVCVDGGYYGEEVIGVTASWYNKAPGWERIRECVSLFNAQTNTERLQQLMLNEYGYLTKFIKQTKNWKLVNVRIKDIVASENILSKTDKDIVEKYCRLHIVRPAYKGHNSAVGMIVSPFIGADGNTKYRIVDGHHRLKSILEYRKKNPRRGLRKVLVVMPRK